jgi:hypothetical protein
MKSIKSCTSACRYCSFYQPEGRRGGMCQQLGVLVQASWKSCNLAHPVFISDWQPMKEIALLEKSFSLGCATPAINLQIECLDIQKSSDRHNQTTPIHAQNK